MSVELESAVFQGTGGQLPDPHQLPGNEETVEKFPDYCLQSHILGSVTGTAATSATTTSTGLPLPLLITNPPQGRPLSLSIQSVASSEYSSYSDRDTAFDSRRSSVISSASSYSYISQGQNSPPEQPLSRNRRDAKHLHAARLQRSGSTSLTIGTKQDGSPNRSKSKRFQRTSSNPADALSATEPRHEQGLTRMAFAEQQRWITVQQKTFTKWLNTKLEARELEVKDLVTDLSDGVSAFVRLPCLGMACYPILPSVARARLLTISLPYPQVILIHLLESLASEPLGRYAAKPKMRVQKFENANLALNFIKSRGIQMTNIGAEDVVDGNRKIILGLIWTLILRFTINDINEEGMTAKEGLLLWCQRKTACYDEVDVRDFSQSWNDGLAFCALLDIHRPDLIDYDALDKSDRRGNMQMAFDIAHKEIGIPKLLDVEDVCDVAKPDERSLMTYIAYWFHAFSQMEKVENAGRRVEKFVNNMQGAWEMQSAYERRMAELLKNIRIKVESWQQAQFEGTYADAKAQATDFASYKRGRKREWVAEKSELATLLGNIKTKLGTYRLRPYEPPAELRLDVMDQEWASLSKSEMTRGQLINETIRE